MISIHCNGAETSSRVRGTESHIHTFNSKKSLSWANSIEEQFSKESEEKVEDKSNK